jgi:hypothetical protein
MHTHYRKKILSCFLGYPNFEEFKNSILPGLLNLSSDVFSPRSSTNEEEWGRDDEQDDEDDQDDGEQEESESYKVALAAAVAAAATIREDASRKIDELA